jgi:teichuronic acid biosynthesis glycosyltransferase TuaG
LVALSRGLFGNLTNDDSRITALKTNKNGGTAVARNVGLRHAKGRYITFLDSGDLLDPNHLEKQLEFIKEHGSLISSGYRRKAKHTCADFLVPEIVDYKSALRGNHLSCLTTVYDKSIIGEVYFPEDIDRPEDYVFWLHILRRGIIARGNPLVLATCNIIEGSKSSNKFELIGCMHKVYHKTQGMNWFKSWIYVFRWAFYGKKKYKNVK